jgi:uncharacterized delta-60 repeat protein
MDPTPSLSARVRGHVAVLAITAGLLIAGTALAGVRLVSGFGHAGVLNLGGGDILGLAAQKGGVVAVGFSGKKMLVVRVGKNGARGKPFGAGQGVATSVVVQSDGKVVVAGTSLPGGTASLAGDMIVKRFNANGSPDKSFGSGGTAHTRGGIANAVALGAHQTIVVAGSIPGSDGTPRVALARLGSNGAADKSFGTKGFSEIDLGPFSQANALAVQSDGKIVFAGDQSPGLQQVNALIGRTSSSGKLDSSFGKKGLYVYLHPKGGGASSFEALAVDSKGRLVGAGCDVENSGQHALFVRLSSRGTPDNGFGSAGVLTSPSERHAVTGALIGPRGLAIGAKGEIVAAGDYLDSAETFAALWTISNGRLDGPVKTALPSALGGESRSIALGSDGGVYTGGDVIGLTAKHALVGRYSVSGLG